MKFIDDSRKKIRWWNRNYFYLGTLAIIAVNILLFHFLGGNFESCVRPDNGSHWHEGFYFVPTIRVFLNAFSHSNWQHVLLNMLCFAGVGFYLERKTGTFGILGLVVVGTYLSSIAVTANDLSVYYHGYSGVNYFMYAYIIIDYVFSFRKSRRNKTNTITGGIILALMYLAMCFTDATSGIPFAWYPYDLLNNLGHGSSFIVGLVFALVVQVSMLIERKCIKDKEN